jgi:hypothetical protein
VPMRGLVSALGWAFTIVWGVVATVLHIAGVPTYVTDCTACINVGNGIKKRLYSCWERVSAVFATRQLESASEESPFANDWSNASFASPTSLSPSLAGSVALVAAVPAALGPRGGQYARVPTASPDPSAHGIGPLGGDVESGRPAPPPAPDAAERKSISI